MAASDRVGLAPPPFATAPRLLAFLLAGFLVGCNQPDLATPTARFASASDQAATTISQALNNEHADAQTACLDRWAADGEPVTPDVLEKDCVGIFSPTALKARLDAIQLVKNYADILSQLASSDAGAKSLTATQDLGTDLQGLAATFGQLAAGPAPMAANPPRAKANANAASYVGPISTVFGWVIEQVQNYQRDRAIKEAIGAASHSVDTILGLLKDDLTLLDEERHNNLSELRASLIRTSRREAAHTPWSERHQLDTEIGTVDAERQAQTQSPASTAIGSWVKANDAMANYLKSPQQPQDIASLTAAINGFVARIQPLTNTVSAPRSAK